MWIIEVRAQDGSARLHCRSASVMMVWYGIVEFNVPLDTV